jgi:hypothetical protein
MLQSHHPEYSCSNDQELILLEESSAKGGMATPEKKTPKKPFG